MQTTNVIEWVEGVRQRVAALKPLVKDSRNLPIGKNVRQGDLYIRRLARVPVDAKLVPVRRQLAEGNTRGARHMLSTVSGVEMFVAAKTTELTGPILRLESEVTIEHPDHGHILLSPGGWDITYQRSLDKDEAKIRRAQD